MIIKSMSRKQHSSIPRLVNYIKKEMTTPYFYGIGAVTSEPLTAGAVITQLERNATYQTRRNGNKFFHEVLSLSNKDAHLPHIEHILVELAQQYLAKRAKRGLGFFAVHLEKINHRIYTLYWERINIKVQSKYDAQKISFHGLSDTLKSINESIIQR